MLIGEFETKLTEKNRIAIPKKIREEFEGKTILSRGYEGCLILLDETRWDDLLKVMSKEPILNLSVRDTKRFLLGGAFEVELDKQGRFVLPNGLKEYSEIDTEISFLGLGEWVEVWAKERWLDKLEELSKSASDIAEKLLKL
ncbi:division/cell wall cluster transcriptional repressor MraZ [Candidatus Dojkabacteria bacterium]|uniref:Transcriptional regulator MraZ n=1 Tax=Candidatus Dojkabacteria bacterium TaxID=2099670 RepID=A0A955RJ84_9BACT|nr:division/cell wall cluster transcriptional repressor MraZ [Candidatus Dojkabacteria bacterium]